MIPDPKKYGVIVEWKTEQPLIMEGYPMNEEQAFARMKRFEADPTVIRVAIFEMVRTFGNRTLIPAEIEQ